ncbi:MAG: twin-arginine translocation signal domain-containing protein [bacterium]
MDRRNFLKLAGAAGTALASQKLNAEEAVKPNAAKSRKPKSEIRKKEFQSWLVYFKIYRRRISVSGFRFLFFLAKKCKSSEVIL